MSSGEALELREDELVIEASRAGGPGGQNVNKVETRVTVRFDLESSARFSALERQRLRERLATRINRAGVLRVSSQKHRSQKANREAAVARLAELIAWALSEDPPRVPTKLPRRAQVARERRKRQQSERKRLRGRVAAED